MINIYIVGLLPIVWIILREIYATWHYNALARKRGCGQVKYVRDFPLGLRTLIKMIKAKKRNGLVESVHSEFEEYGSTYRSEVSMIHRMVTRDPENIKTVLATNFKDYSLGRRYNAMFPLLGNGIFTLSAEPWKHSRNMLRPQFSRHQVSQLESLSEHVQMLINNFNDPANASPQNDGLVEAQVLFHKLTLDTATEFLFGESVNSLANSTREVQGPQMKVTAVQFADAFNYGQHVLADRAQAGKMYWLYGDKAFKHATKVCHNFVDYFVLKAIAEEEARKASGEAEKEQSESSEISYIFIKELAKHTSDVKVIRDQALNILLAGRDTTASFLSFFTYFMARDRRVWNKLREIVLADFGYDQSSISFESLKRCTYMNHVVNEILRLCPIVPLNSRTAIRDTILPRGGGPNGDEPVLVLKGEPVTYSVHSMHHAKEYWGEDASKFNPERWEQSKMASHMWDFLPFNGGPRICLGQQFALTEIMFTIVRLMQTYKAIETSPERLAEPFHQQYRLTASVASGVWVKFVPI